MWQQFLLNSGFKSTHKSKVIHSTIFEKSWPVWLSPGKLIKEHYKKEGLLSELSWWRIHLLCRRPQFDSWVGKIHWRRDRLLTPVFLGFPCGSAGKESTCNAGDLGSIPELGRSPGEGKGYRLQYSGLENSMDCMVHGVTKSRTWLSDFHFTSWKSNHVKMVREYEHLNKMDKCRFMK